MKPSLIQKQLKFNSDRIWQYECLMYSYEEHNKTIKQYPERFGMADVIIDDNKRVIASFKKSIKSLAELQKALKKQASRYVFLNRNKKRLIKSIDENPWNVSELTHKFNQVMDDIYMLENY